MFDDGRFASICEFATAKKLDRGYLGRILMLTLLAPDVVEAIMDGGQPAELGVHVLREGYPVEWREQRGALAGCPIPPNSIPSTVADEATALQA